ncbi:Fe2+-enterobactin ABC transporter substrate-binding protein [Vibrio sonorensis]|uniref:Fe2+-enterobactin ABC transporter substrate-binding protein n=1 Tax=Vibrio sonorensis TaxID=1004316 RepID=UPI0008DA800A|nr:Fe2+-enterobactin ABC transporter substrate-binding protein [Vibrio sonorensis]
MLSLSKLNKILGLACLILLIGCSEESPPNKTENQLTISDGWPKYIVDSYGETTLDQPPTRIVSTSVTLTGTLLAIDAPLIASGAARTNTKVADDIGFFRQWSDIASERNVISLYQGEANAETVAKQKPDLILVSATGGDSALKLYKQFSTIAPTIVINYDDKSWQELAGVLAQITGREDRANEVIEDFEHRLSLVKEQIELPPQPTSALAYYGDGRGGNFWTNESAQGKILTSLGFELSELPEDLKDNPIMGQRKDIFPVNGERFADAITGQSILLFAANEQSVEQVKKNKFISHLDPVKGNQVFAMGNDTFRLDYYSSMNLLDTLDSTFGKRD